MVKHFLVAFVSDSKARAQAPIYEQLFLEAIRAAFVQIAFEISGENHRLDATDHRTLDALRDIEHRIAELVILSSARSKLLRIRALAASFIRPLSSVNQLDAVCCCLPKGLVAVLAREPFVGVQGIVGYFSATSASEQS